jgi:hypothetical protein
MSKYKTYYGRKKSRILRALTIVLLVAGFVGFCIFISNYITLSDDGLSIDLPFLAWVVRRAPPPPPPDDGLTIDIQTPSPPEEEEPAPPPSPSVRPEQVRALFLPMNILGDAAALTDIRQRALEDGANMLALEYKDTRGTIVNANILADALDLLQAPGITLTAVITAGVDNTIPRGGPNTHWALKVSGVNFVDGSLDTGNRWLNLYMREVREYIVSLTAGAYDAGFDRVLLTHVGFPHTRGANRIDYNGYDLTVGPVAAVGALISELRDAAGDRPLDVWLFENTYNEGVFETAGQDLAEFAQVFDLMFVTLPDDVTSIEEPFIPILPADGSDVSYKIELSGQGFMLYSRQGRYN